MNSIIQSCTAVGGKDAEVLKYHVEDKLDPLYLTYKGYHTGVDLSGTVACSIIPGTVLYTGKDNNSKCVIIQFNNKMCIQYKELDHIVVEGGQTVEFGQQIGTAKKYVHIDLLTQVTSGWPVRVRGLTYYKHDPLDVITNGYAEYDTDLPYQYDVINSEAADMLSNNAGDDKS